MGKPVTSTIGLLLLASGSLVFAGQNNPSGSIASDAVVTTGQASGGHEGTEALKAEISDLKTKLSNTDTGRNYLLGRLQEALDELKTTKSANIEQEKQIAELEKSLQMVADSRDHFSNELDQLKSVSAENQQLTADLQRALNGREFLSGQSKRNRLKLMDERKENARLTQALERALRGRDFLTTESDERQVALTAEKAETARLSLALERALRGRDFLSTESDERQAALTAEKAETARLSLALERALLGRNYLSDLVEEKEAELEAARKETDQIAEVSFIQINSAIEEANTAKKMLTSTAWADQLATDLTTEFSGMEGTQVTSLSNNSVAIKVGNTGLFRLGSTVLSDNGRETLNSIGTAIAERSDSHIKIVGHTDNIPTGSGSRFANNQELSLARATSTLRYMTSIGVPAERLSAQGVGAAYPIASNDTSEGQLANRRVEILLTPAK